MAIIPLLRTSVVLVVLLKVTLPLIFKIPPVLFITNSFPAAAREKLLLIVAVGVEPPREKVIEPSVALDAIYNGPKSPVVPPMVILPALELDVIVPEPAPVAVPDKVRACPTISRE